MRTREGGIMKAPETIYKKSELGVWFTDSVPRANCEALNLSPGGRCQEMGEKGSSGVPTPGMLTCEVRGEGG